MTSFHHRALPDYSTLLAGRTPPDAVGFATERLQVWFNHTTEHWADPKPHVHTQSDECFIVLSGSLLVEVDGAVHRIGPREFCCFPSGTPHAVIQVEPPVETLMIRAPSVDDKLYQASTERSDPPLERAPGRGC